MNQPVDTSMSEDSHITVTDDEVKEVILHCAIYCGVPAANAAFRVAQEVLAEETE